MGAAQPQLPELSWITVYETGSSGANFNGRDYRIWKEMTLDSAVRLREAPAGHHLAALHGHTTRCACTWPRRSTPCRAGRWTLAM